MGKEKSPPFGKSKYGLQHQFQLQYLVLIEVAEYVVGISIKLFQENVKYSLI